MAIGPGFLSRGPLGEGRCLWCGGKLPKRFDVERVDPTRPHSSDFRKLPTFRLGAYGDGYFCGLRCGRDFGVRAAQLNFRLREVKR